MSAGGPPPKRQRGAGASASAPVTQPSDGDSLRNSVVSINRLSYVLDPDLSVAVSRTMVNNFFSQSSYQPNSRAICILNTGSSFVDPATSYLTFTVKNTSSGTGELDLGVGSAINFIRTLTITSRSGDTLERCDRVSTIAPIRDRYMRDEQWLRTTGAMIGYAGQTTAGTQTNFNVIEDSGERRYTIPLSCLCGVFNLDRLLPSSLCAGLRFEIEFNDPITASMCATDGKFEISNAQIVTDCVTLSDSAQRAILETTASSGLEIVYKTLHNQQSVQSQEMNIEVRKAVSRCLRVISVPHYNIANTGEQNQDSFRSPAFDLISYQVRLGSLYFPTQALQGENPVDILTQMYAHVQRGWGIARTPSAPSSVSLAQFQGDSTAGGLAAWMTTLERYSALELTGVPTNSSRSLEIRAKNANADVAGTSVLVDVFLEHVRLCRCFINNVSISE